MKFKKKVFKLGSSHAIILDKVIIDSYGIEAGDYVNISDMVVEKKEEDTK